MGEGRTLLLFDPRVQPPNWNERMATGEYAVLYSALNAGPEREDDGNGHEPSCTVFSSLPGAEAHAAEQVKEHPALRCRIYDCHGLGREPIREVFGQAYKGESEVSTGFRRWGGAGLFLVGIGLVILDWQSDFSLTWPATLGTRIFPVGLILLAMELGIVLERKRKARRGAK